MFVFAVDCQESEYGDWSKCSKTCGGGERTSIRTVQQEPLNGGKTCEGVERKVESCNENTCPGINIIIKIIWN